MDKSSSKRSRPSSLRLRALILMLVAFTVISIPAYFAFVWIVNSAVLTMGTAFAEKQILYDRYRGLGALMQEVKLAETLARSDAILAWARAEELPEARARGLAELEHYREAFSDHSYFFALAESGSYYFNDADNSFAGKQLNHTLSRDNPDDSWFYNTLALGTGCHLNVNNDRALQVTKVWFNCVVSDSSGPVGVLGSGLDLTAFIRQVVDVPQQGVQSMFVDASGALQAHRDPKLIDFHSISKTMLERRTIFSLIDSSTDRQALRTMMNAVTTDEVAVRSRFMKVGGREMLVGVGYLDKLDWYNVTLMDVDRIIDKSQFLPIGLLLAGLMIACVALLGLLFQRQVLDRLKRMESRMVAVKEGDLALVQADPAGDEIGRLSQTFASMAASVSDNTRMLEQMVRERTEELQRLAYRDQLTDILNRRGFIDAYEAVQRGRSTGSDRMGLMVIDLDQFKQINDTFGHMAGDLVITETARRLTDIIRPTDVCGRWGGDEFIVLINGLGAQSLRAIAEVVRQAVTGTAITLADGRQVKLTVSVGTCLVDRGDSIDAVVDMADAALYAAKSQGRDRVVVYDPVRNDVDRRRAV